MHPKINPRKDYTSTDILRENLFPWAKHPLTLKKLIRKDAQGENLLEVKIEGVGRQTRYLIKGKNLLRFTRKYGTYLLGNVRKAKTNKKRVF